MRSFKKVIYLCLLVSVISINSIAQTYHRTIYGVEARIDSINIRIEFFNNDIVRVVKSPSGIIINKKSFTVIKKPERIYFRLRHTDSTLNIISKSLDVALNLQNGQVNFLNISGKLLLSENGTDFNPCEDSLEHSFSVKQFFRLTPGEAIYGLGQHQTGILNRRNQQIVLKQHNMQIAIPYLYSTNGYGLFWDNTSSTIYKDTLGENSFSSEVGDCVDYYFLRSDNADRGLAQWRSLSGQAPLFPHWAFGYWQSRQRFKSQEELLDAVTKYRSLKVPLDVIVQDWQYWGADKKTWNSTLFNNSAYPNPQQMADSVHRLNAHIVISVWPSFGDSTDIFKDFKRRGMLYNMTAGPPSPFVKFYDAFNPAARDVYWNFMNRNLFSIGIDGWWLDSSEPGQRKSEKSDDDNKTYRGLFGKVRNAYPIETVKGVYEHQRMKTSMKRVVILTRSAFAGQQRFSSANWSGDIVSGWDVLQQQITNGLNMSFSGIPYWTSDIGGFFSKYNYPEGIKDTTFHELYVRWIQFGTFCPLMRSHGSNTPREIYQFGKKGNWAYDAIEKFIDLRYRLLPYIYSTAWKVTSQSFTFMRAPVMDFPNDKKLYNLNNEYLFGNSLLVCPITEPLYVSKVNNKIVTDFSHSKKWNVYLPQGSEWYDFWTGEKISGGQQVLADASIDKIPLFVKAGAIIPMGPIVQYADQQADSVLEIRIYPGADGQFTLYEDENDNYDYEKGIFSTINIKWDDKHRSVTIGDRKGSFPGMLKKRVFKFIIAGINHGNGINVASFSDKTVTYNGKRIVSNLK